MYIKVLNLILAFLVLNATDILAVNTSAVKDEKKEIVQKRGAQKPLGIKQKLSLFLLNKWTKQNAKKKKKTKSGKVNGDALGSFFGSILSIIGLVSALAASNVGLILLFGLLGVASLIFGLRGLKKAREDSDVYKGKAFSIIGISIGAISSLIFLFLLFWIVLVAGIFFIF